MSQPDEPIGFEEDTPLTFAEQKAKFEEISKSIEENGGLSIKFSNSCQYSDPSAIDAQDRRKPVIVVSTSDSEESVALSVMAVQWAYFWERSAIDPEIVLTSSASEELRETATLLATRIVFNQQRAMIAEEKEKINQRRMEARERLGLPYCAPEDLPKTLHELEVNESLGFNVPLSYSERGQADEAPVTFRLATDPVAKGTTVIDLMSSVDSSMVCSLVLWCILCCYLLFCCVH